MSRTKDTNPKDAVGSRKFAFSALPIRALAGAALGMLEGAGKYRRHNYRRAGVRASVYFDACCRHLFAWWEGQDIDPDSLLNHIDKAIASLLVLRDSMLEGNWVDDRPPACSEWVPAANEQAARIIDHTVIQRGKFEPPYTETGCFDPEPVQAPPLPVGTVLTVHDVMGDDVQVITHTELSSGVPNV